MQPGKLIRRPRSSSELRLLFLLLPVLVYDMTLQVLRLGLRYEELLRHPQPMGVLGWLAPLGSPLLYHLGLVTICAGLICATAGRRRASAAALVAAQVLCIATVLIETAAYVYFLDTDSSLDWPQFHYWVGRLDDLSLFAQEALSWGEWTAPLAMLGAVIVLPWAAPRLKRALGEPAIDLPHSRGGALAMIGVGALILTVGILPLTDEVTNSAVIRDPALNLVFTAFTESEVDLAAESAAAILGRPFELRIRRARAVPRRNVVFVILESTRAPSVTAYVPTLPTTPFLAELAQRSLVGERAYAVIPHTSKALIAILCSMEPSHGVTPRALKLGLLSSCLPELLEDHGYESVFFQSADPAFEWRIPTTKAMGFDEFIGTNSFSTVGFEKANFLGWDDEVMLAPSRAWLATHLNGPFIAAYLTVAAHYEYRPLHRHGHVHFADEDPPLDNYLNALRADDFFLRALFDQYKQLGLYENTIFVVVGDHGEAFGEHGRRTHDDVPYEEGLLVPLVVHDPTGRLVHPGRITAPVSQLDVLPTILDALGYEVVRGRPHGISMLRRQQPRKLMASCFNEETCLAEIDGTEKYIHHFGRQPDQYFDLRVDPGEHDNLASQRRQATARMLEEVLAWDRHVHGLYWGNELPSKR
jgi:lipoteichoic acid synthase